MSRYLGCLALMSVAIIVHNVWRDSLVETFLACQAACCLWSRE